MNDKYIVAPGLPSASYLSYVVCKLLHRSGKLKNNYDKVKYQLFSVTSLVEAHCQENVCLRTMMPTLKRT
ncbi:hypothetical protein H5410_010362 [Solanum commersonii]|uniref:Uncharacterized protein n=1 Tax=Solanum commersonii TaxID=4109 RepID=A0A9J6AKH1_SOLCO|nr:hypothetical protein H5410_010362 [Solanum commersonii]